MASQLKRMMFLISGLLVLQTANAAFAQGRMGMMMARQQMVMNAGMMGQFNPNLTTGFGNNWSLSGNRGLGYLGYGGYGGYGGGYSDYSGQYPSGYSGETSYSRSYPRRRSYSDEPAALTPQEERERLHQIELIWSQGELSEFETRTGIALNILLADLRDLQAQGIHGPDLTLDEELLRHINVLAGRSNGNLGLFRDDGRLSWPLILRGPEFLSEREIVNALAPKMVQQAKEGQAIDLLKLASAVAKLHEELHARIADISSPDYIRTKRFLTQLDDAVKLLRQPEAGNYFNQIYAARGKTVAELVRNMTQLDLRFAPAVEGDEPAYHALHQMLVAYDRAAHAQLLAKK
jgi:hypothetical protein